jgi:hypothetical protein
VIHFKQIRGAALAGASALMLTGCLLSPGKFTSELALMKDGSFSYDYTGEIQMLALSKLAQMGKDEESFTASCTDDDTFEERECTEDEVAEQKAEWDEGADQRAAKRKKEAEEMKMLLGGIDPSNPQAAQEFAARLERQRGWDKVEYVGDGLFNVVYHVSGQLSHDFTFPTVEKLPMANAFVTVVLRDEGQVRIDAPGFGSEKSGGPMQGMPSGLAGLAQMAMLGEDEEDKAGRLALPDGAFSVVTDGRILANNTDEGPARHTRGQVLSWTISPRTEQVPTALIAFD